MVEAKGLWRQSLRTLSDVLTGSSEASDRCIATDQILAQALAERGYPRLSLNRFRRDLSERTLSDIPWAGDVLGRSRQLIRARLTRNKEQVRSVLPGVEVEALTNIVNAFCYRPYLHEVKGYDTPKTVEMETMVLTIPTLGMEVSVSETGHAIGQVAGLLYDTGHIKVMRRNGRGYMYLAYTIDPLLSLKL